MLPNPGVTTKEPFTSGVLDYAQKRALLRNLHRLIGRADRRVRAGDRAAIDAEFNRVGVKPTMEIDFLAASGARAAAVLETLLVVYRTVTPYLVQPDDTVTNQPFPTGKRIVLDQMVQEVTKTFDEIAGGAADAEILSTFAGADPGQLTTVRKTFGLASAALNALNQKQWIYADTRGDLDVQGAAALTGTTSMLLPTSFADARTDTRVRTLLHETFHAVHQSIIDHVYEGDPSFGSLAITDKLTNADHYAHVARVHAKLQPDAPGKVTVVPIGVVLTPDEEEKARKAITIASNRLTRAWVRTLWDLQFMGRIGLYRDPSRADDLVLRRLRRISELAGLTLHSKASLDASPGAEALKLGRATVAAPAILPFPVITEYDRAVLEEVVSDTHALVGWAHRQSDVCVVGAGTPPASAWLTATAVQNPANYPTGLAIELLNQAVVTLPSPWMSSGDLLRLVEALRMEAGI